MIRSLRVLAISAFAIVVYSGTAHAIAGPELDPGSMAAGLTVLAIGTVYLIERYRRR